jgi:hypothetical protein
MTAELSQRAAPGQLATAAPIDRFRLLDAFTGGLVEPRKQQPTLATISAGYNANAGKKDAKMQPVVSRDGTIYVDGRENLALAFDKVKGLAAALQKTNRTRLTITFPFDEPDLFIRQHFTCRSASRLQVYGSHAGLTRIREAGSEYTDRETGEVTKLARPMHEFYPAGSEEFEALLPYVKVETSIYFFLAGWEGRQAQVLMPDGLGLYRLRMTSRNSAHNIVNSLKWISQLTGGRFAGVPFDLWHEQMEVPGPDGRRRHVPVWNLIPRPPEALALTSGNFREIFASALVQGEQLKILPPPVQTIDVAALEGPAYDAPLVDGPTLEGIAEEVEPEERPAITRQQQEAFNSAMRGGLCDPTRSRRIFFGTYGDTVLNDPGPRAAMVREYSHGKTTSLGEYLADATEGEAAGIISFGQLWLNRKAEAERPPRQMGRVIEGTAAPIEVPTAPEPATQAEEQPARQAWDDEPESPEFDLDDVLPLKHSDQVDSSSSSSSVVEKQATKPEDDDPFTRDRETRAALMAELNDLLEQAAAVGFEVEEINLDELSNAELAGAVEGLTGKLARHREAQGALL